MNVKCYRLYDQAVTLQPAAGERTWLQANEMLSADLALDHANRQGWQLLCPLAFEATWNGGPNPEDIEIRLAGDATGEDDVAGAVFVQSTLGAGLLTFYPGYQ